MRLTKDEEKTMRAARKAYEAYCKTTNWKSLITGDDLPQWDDLPARIRNAWFSSATAVREYLE